MMKDFSIEKSERIDRLIKDLYATMPRIEKERAHILTKVYQETEGEPIIRRRAKAFYAICCELPIVIRPDELIVGSNALAPRSCQTFPEYSHEWLTKEFDTIEQRSADPFSITEEVKTSLKEIHTYWEGKTTSDLAHAYMSKEALKAIEHNVFTVGNYYYNGIGHVSVQYDKVLKKGFGGVIQEAKDALSTLKISDGDYVKKADFLHAVILSCEGAIIYAKRYAKMAQAKADTCHDMKRRQELLQIAKNCTQVPEYGAQTFYEACQAFWFVQMLLQTESSGHSISPGRFDQYMYPYLKKDLEEQTITERFAQELIDCIWIKFNDLNKARDADSAEGFAGYSLFQNLIVGGQTEDGLDGTNILSYMCLEATLHVMLPAPSLSVRVWNRSPNDFLLKAATLVRTGIGLPAYYNDEVIIPSLQNRGLTLKDARDYCIIGCVEPQKGGKTDGWHDAAFFNMLKPLEMVFSNGIMHEDVVGLQTGKIEDMKTFEQFFDAYQRQMEYFIELLVNACNSIDVAHSQRCPLPFQSSLIDDCIGRKTSLQEGGAIYNFTGPQGFGIANMADAMMVIKRLVFEEKKLSLTELKEALDQNFGKTPIYQNAHDPVAAITKTIISELAAKGYVIEKEKLGTKRLDDIYHMIQEVPKYGNDCDAVDLLAREIAYTYTRPIEKYKNPRHGVYQAGLYPVSANVPLGAQTGATPDGRYANTPIADGVGPAQGRDVKGPTAAANSVAKLDHMIASNGTLYNQKFHPSALSGINGLQNFTHLIRGFFDQKGMHMQFNVVSKETLLDAQAHPEKYKGLVVRVAGYSAHFTTLSKSLQDDIISRTTQGL